MVYRFMFLLLVLGVPQVMPLQAEISRTDALAAVSPDYAEILEQGRAFQTKAGIEKIEAILSMAINKDSSLLNGMSSKWENILRKSSYVHFPEQLIVDGWGDKYKVTVVDGVVKVRSENYENYLNR